MQTWAHLKCFFFFNLDPKVTISDPFSIFSQNNVSSNCVVLLFHQFNASLFILYLQVYIVDSFLVQGPKVLVRAGLIVYSQFAKFIEKEGIPLKLTGNFSVLTSDIFLDFYLL